MRKSTNQPIKKFMKSIWKNVLFVLGVIGVSLFLQQFVLTSFLVNGTSMDPTFASNDRVMMFRIIQPSRFDVVVIDSPDETYETQAEGGKALDFFGQPIRRMYIKRVIGMPGDHLEYKNDQLWINGERYEEPYLTASRQAANTSGKFYMPNETLEDIIENAKRVNSQLPIGNVTLVEKNGRKVIPDDYYLVMGDNRINSKDSEEYGLVHKSLIKGVVFMRFLPFDRLQITPFNG